MRSLLIVAAIAIPVATGVTVSTVAATAHDGPEEYVQDIAGAADARVQIGVPEGGVRVVSDDNPLEADAAFRQLLPPGVTSAMDADLYAVGLSGDTVSRVVTGRVSDVTDPLFAPLYELESGQLSDDPATMALSPALATKLGAGVGDEVSLEGVGEPFTVAAIIAVRYNLAADFFVIPSSALDSGQPLAHAIDRPDVELDVGEARWLVGLPDGADARALVERMAAEGYEVETRSELTAGVAATPLADPAGMGLGAGLLIEVGLFTAAALAVVFRSLRRQIGLLTAIGANARFRRACLLAYCGSLGLLGGVAGSVLGLAVSSVLTPYLASQAKEDWGPLTPAWGSVAVLVACAGAVALLAGHWPARLLMRAEVTQLLRGDHTQGYGKNRRVRVLSVVGVIGATGLLVASASMSGGLALTAVAAAVGVVSSLSLIVSLLSARMLAMSGSLRPSLRITFRTLAGMPGRTWLLLCGTTFVLAATLAILVPFHSAVANSADTHYSYAPYGSSLVAAYREFSDMETEQLRANVGAKRIARFTYAAVPLDHEPELMQARVVTDFIACSGSMAADDPGKVSTCHAQTGSYNYQSWLGIAHADELPDLIGRQLEAGESQAYAEGSAVTVSESLSSASQIEVTHYPLGATMYPTIANIDSFPGASAADYLEVPVAFISPGTASRIGLVPHIHGFSIPDASAHGLMAITLIVPDEQEVLDWDDITAALPLDMRENSVTVVETGAQFQQSFPRIVGTSIAITVLTAAGAIAVAMSLWASSLRNDYLMLGAIGAPRRWQRAIGAWNGLAIAVVSLTAATLWGVGAAVAFLNASDAALSFPWAAYLALTLLVGLAASGLGALLVPTGGRAMRQPV